MDTPGEFCDRSSRVFLECHQELSIDAIERTAHGFDSVSRHK
jgi:hypothetical protein